MYKLAFKNEATGKGMILEAYKTKREATERKAAWDELHRKQNVPVTVTIIKTA